MLDVYLAEEGGLAKYVYDRDLKLFTLGQKMKVNGGVLGSYSLYNSPYCCTAFGWPARADTVTFYQVDRHLEEGEQSHFEVEAILCRTPSNHAQVSILPEHNLYWVKWKRWEDWWNSWVDYENLFCPDILAEFIKLINPSDFQFFHGG